MTASAAKNSGISQPPGVPAIGNVRHRKDRLLTGNVFHLRDASSGGITVAEQPCHWINTTEFEWWAVNRKLLAANTTVHDYVMWISHAERQLRYRGICLTEATLEELLLYFDSLKPTANLRANVRCALIACGEYLVWAGIREDVPAKELPRWKVKRGTPKPIGHGQVAPFIKAANDAGPMWGCLVTVYLYTGVRATELRNRRWAHIADNYLHVVRKGGRPDSVFLCPQALDAIERWRKVCPDKKWMFPSPVLPDQPIGYEWTRRKIKRIAEEVGVDEFKLHRLRHTFAMEYCRKDPDPWGLADALGHADLQNVTVYAKSGNERRERAMLRLYKRET